MKPILRAGVVCFGLLTTTALVACGGRVDGPIAINADAGTGPAEDAGTDSFWDAPSEDSADGISSDRDGDAGDAGWDAANDDATDGTPPSDCSAQLPCLPPPPPSTKCPAPIDISSGKSCAGIKSGLICPGNPLSCNGAPFYDAVQCDGAAWITVAATICGIDGGVD